MARTQLCGKSQQRYAHSWRRRAETAEPMPRWGRDGSSRLCQSFQCRKRKKGLPDWGGMETRRLPRRQREAGVVNEAGQQLCWEGPWTPGREFGLPSVATGSSREWVPCRWPRAGVPELSPSAQILKQAFLCVLVSVQLLLALHPFYSTCSSPSLLWPAGGGGGISANNLDASASSSTPLIPRQEPPAAATASQGSPDSCIWHVVKGAGGNLPFLWLPLTSPSGFLGKRSGRLRHWR